MKKLLFLILPFLCVSISFAQELNCKVQILTPNSQGSAEINQLVDALKTSVFELMNNTKWTDDSFQDHEKIECNLLINVSNIKSLKDFTATLQVTSRRPVYNSNYSSTVVNTVDKQFNFTYQQNTPLVFTRGAYTSELASVLAFYAYYVIGMDYDSFSLEGGTPYFIKAQEISNLAQSGGGAGWDNKDNNNRAVIIENILNAQFKQMRKSVYEYHRLGLDNAYTDNKLAVSNMTKALTLLQDVHARQPGSINMRIYFIAKADEVVNIYSGDVEQQDKNNVFNIVRRIDPGNIAKYQQIIKR